MRSRRRSIVLYELIDVIVGALHLSFVFLFRLVIKYKLGLVPCNSLCACVGFH